MNQISKSSSSGHNISIVFKLLLFYFLHKSKVLFLNLQGNIYNMHFYVSILFRFIHSKCMEVFTIDILLWVYFSILVQLAQFEGQTILIWKTDIHFLKEIMLTDLYLFIYYYQSFFSFFGNFSFTNSLIPLISSSLAICIYEASQATGQRCRTPWHTSYYFRSACFGVFKVT